MNGQYEVCVRDVRYLICVASSLLLRYEQAAAVADEAAVGPEGVVEGEGSAVLLVARILDGDDVVAHGDDTATACILLRLQHQEQRHKQQTHNTINQTTTTTLSGKQSPQPTNQQSQHNSDKSTFTN